ncbi:MAG TPA: hypothetical protein VD908_01385 [Cytophagales bacterium]|nr:hypothetical protein [Cytophagales bacterium]
MKKAISIFLTIIFSLTIVFHILVLVGLVPYDIVWGGRVKSVNDMYLFEAISLFLNAVFLFVVSAKSRVVKIRVSEKLLNVLLWIMAGVFLLNTLGNLMSTSELEKMIFTPVTLLLSILCILLALPSKGSELSKI